MSRIIKIFLAIIFLSTVCYAQVKVNLKNGRQMQGYFVSIDEKKIVIGVPSGHGEIKTSLYKEDVNNIEGFSFDEFLRARNTYETGHFEGKEKGFASSFNDAVKLVEDKRDLKFISEVKHEIVSREKIKQYLEKKIQEENEEEEISKEHKLLAKLGIIGKNIDYKKMMTDLFAKNVSGLYDPKEKKMYVIDEAASVYSSFLPSEVVIHELTHALQDQYISLIDVEGKIKNADTDKSLALKAIIEGEATFVSYGIFADVVKKVGSQHFSKASLDSIDIEKFFLESMLLVTKSLSPEFQNKALLNYMLFPYINGAMFVKYAYDNGGWEKVDQLYKNPPSSTEQILHPEKYFLVQNKPLDLAQKDLSFLSTTGFKEVSKGTLGEFTIYTVAITYLDDLFARMMSSGWGNDIYYLYEKKATDTENSSATQELLLIMDTRWDSVSEAEEFYKGTKALLDKKYSELKWKEAKDNFIGSNDGNTIYIGKKADEILVIESENKDKALMVKILQTFSYPYEDL
jgi:hypothetical protein